MRGPFSRDPSMPTPPPCMVVGSPHFHIEPPSRGRWKYRITALELSVGALYTGIAYPSSGGGGKKGVIFPAGRPKPTYPLHPHVALWSDCPPLGNSSTILIFLLKSMLLACAPGPFVHSSASSMQIPYVAGRFHLRCWMLLWVRRITSSASMHILHVYNPHHIRCIDLQGFG